jgi:hypothetical protein
MCTLIGTLDNCTRSQLSQVMEDVYGRYSGGVEW